MLLQHVSTGAHNKPNTGSREGLEQPMLGCQRCGVFKLAATTPQNSTKSYTLDFMADNSSVSSQIPHNSDATKLDTHISFNYEHKINYVLPEKCSVLNAEGSKSDDSFLQFIFNKVLHSIQSAAPRQPHLVILYCFVRKFKRTY